MFVYFHLLVYQLEPTCGIFASFGLLSKVSELLKPLEAFQLFTLQSRQNRDGAEPSSNEKAFSYCVFTYFAVWSCVQFDLVKYCVSERGC